jgi:hypothetical protein
LCWCAESATCRRRAQDRRCGIRGIRGCRAFQPGRRAAISSSVGHGSDAASARHTRPLPVVIKDARRIDGPLTFWQKDDKVWIELRPTSSASPSCCRPRSRAASARPGCWAG